LEMPGHPRWQCIYAPKRGIVSILHWRCLNLYAHLPYEKLNGKSFNYPLEMRDFIILADTRGVEWLIAGFNSPLEMLEKALMDLVVAYYSFNSPLEMHRYWNRSGELKRLVGFNSPLEMQRWAEYTPTSPPMRACFNSPLEMPKPFFLQPRGCSPDFESFNSPLEMQTTVCAKLTSTGTIMMFQFSIGDAILRLNIANSIGECFNSPLEMPYTSFLRGFFTTTT